ncbi:MAG: ArsR/SmtB family transcription factor [Planctomycetota bacterium]|jgi:ArsR family transcriptional regulator
MDKEVEVRMKAKAEVFKALAHPTRLFMVEVLSKGERCACELVEMVGADKSTVSKHLSLLKTAGILSDRKQGTMVFYTLEAVCVTHFMKCVEGMITGRLTAMRNVMERSS